VRFVARRSRYAAVDQGGRDLEIAKLEQVVANYGAPLIATYWIDNALPLATMLFAHPGLEAFARRFRFLIDDTFGGRVSGYSIDSAGGRFVMLALPGNPLRLSQVSAVIAEGGSCIFPVDGGGPYREVGTGIIGLASALRASIVPLSVQASRSFAYPHRSRVRVPLPGGRIVIAVGAPIAVRRQDPRRETAALVRNSLNEIEKTASAAGDRDHPFGSPRLPRHLGATESI
jgi:hypothetical protein